MMETEIFFCQHIGCYFMEHTVTIICCDFFITALVSIPLGHTDNFDTQSDVFLKIRISPALSAFSAPAL